MSVGVRSAFKNLDRHKFHGSSTMPRSTQTTVQLFRQIQVDKLASWVPFLFYVRNDKVVFRNVAVEYPSVVIQRSMAFNNIAKCLKQFFNRSELVNRSSRRGNN